MTSHYNIEILKTSTFFKVTFRNKKFKKIEHLRGKLNRELMDVLGKVIPVNEDEISRFNKVWFQRVNYTIVIKSSKETLHTQFRTVWFEFFKKENNGNSPKHGAVEGRSLNQIIAYLKSQSITEEEALSDWKMILDNWQYLSEFNRKQVDLKYINSKLNVIIKELQTHSKSTTDSFESAMESETAKRFKFG